MKKLIYTLIIIMVAGFLFWQFKGSIIPGSSLQHPGPYVTINDRVIKVEIADDFEKMRRGLSDREYLGENEGMIFVFSNKQIRRFWMKNMHFPLDIIWIDDNKIIQIDQNLLPEGDQPENSYRSVLPVNYVLEVNGGFIDKHNIKAGDKVYFNL